MYRLMQPSDRAAVVALWQKERGDTAEFINTAMDRFAGEQNVYVAEENGQIEAAALAVPGYAAGPPGQLPVWPVRAGQPDFGGFGGYSLRPAEAAGRRALRWPRPPAPERAALLPG